MKIRGIVIFTVLLGMAIGTQAALPEIGDTIWLRGGRDNSYVYASGSILVAKEESNVANALNFVVHSADGSDSNFIFQVADTTSYVGVSTNNPDSLDLVISATDTNSPLTHFTMVEITGGYSLRCEAIASKPVVHERGGSHTLKAHSDVAGSINATWTYGVVGDPILVPPTGLGASTSDSQVVLDWDNDVSGLVDTYTVYRSTNTPVTVSDDVLGNPTVSAFTDTNVVNGTTYYYAVSASDAGSNETDLSNEVSVTPPTGTEAPKRLKASGVAGAVILDWADDDTGFLDYYTVYRSATSNITTSSMVLTNVTKSTFKDFDVLAGSNYFYAVTAFGTNGVPQESALSDVASATPFAAVTNSVLFQHLDATDGGSITLSNGNEVLSVADLTTFENDADVGVEDQDSPVLWPSTDLFASGLSGLDMATNRATLNLFTTNSVSGGLETLLNFKGAAASSDGFAVLVAFKTRTIPAKDNFIIHSGNLEMIYGDDGAMEVTLGSTTIAQTGTVVQAGDSIVYALNYNALNGKVTFWDSKNETQIVDNTDVYGNFAGNGQMRLGGSGNASRIFDGLIGEVKIFSTKLPAEEFEAQRDALVTKWVSTDSSGYDVWALSWGVDLGSATDDWDNDNVNNLAEYAFAGNPTNGFDDTQIELVNDNGLVYIHPKPKNDADLNYEVQTIDILGIGTWTNEGYTSVIGTYEPAEGDYNYVSNSVPTADPVKFIRTNAEY